MSTNGNILFTKDVMAELRYGAMSAFYAFMNDEKINFHAPLRLGDATHAS